MSKMPPKQFRVGSRANGDDYDIAEIDAMVYRIALWFRDPQCGRSYPDPVAAAREKVKQCLLAQTDAGDPWKNCPTELAARIKIKTTFDVVTGVGTAQKRVKHGVRSLDKVAQAQAQELKHTNFVQEAFDQDTFRLTIETDILAAFPELDNPAHRPNVRSLSGLYAQREVMDRELALGMAKGARELTLKSLKMVEEMADVTMKRLGVHPDQVRKKINDKMASTVGDLVAMIDEDPNFRAREKTWALTLALQFYWMSEHYNGRRTGPQLADFEIWHMTRTRPLRHKCKCGYECILVEGFEPLELRDWLLKEGVLVEDAVIPGLFSDENLAGLATADLQGVHDVEGAHEDDTDVSHSEGSLALTGDPAAGDGL